MRAHRTLIRELKAALAGEADHRKAEKMRAYMKSEMPFYGVAAPQLRSVLADIFPAHPITDPNRWAATILALWREAHFREERYAAIELAGSGMYRDFQSMDALPMYEEMIVTGAWWDLVDGIAIHRIGGDLLRLHSKRMKPVLRSWSMQKDLWKRRTSIISQVSFKDRTDLELLYSCIARNVEDRDFFIRKAIGWALRAYAWHNPAEVRRYVTANEKVLSPLSRREALKNIG